MKKKNCKRKTIKQTTHIHKSITFQSCAYPSKINLPIPRYFSPFFCVPKKEKYFYPSSSIKKNGKKYCKWNGENILQKS